VREQMASSERRAMVLAGELEELRTQLEAAERARKSAEAELSETADRVSELAGSNNSLVTAKRKLEIDIQAMQVCHFAMNYCNSNEVLAPGAARRYAPRRWQFDPKIAADLRPSAYRSAVRTSLVAGGG